MPGSPPGRWGFRSAPSRIEKTASKQVQRLLRAAGDLHVLHLAADSALGHGLNQILAEGYSLHSRHTAVPDPSRPGRGRMRSEPPLPERAPGQEARRQRRSPLWLLSRLQNPRIVGRRIPSRRRANRYSIVALPNRGYLDLHVPLICQRGKIYPPPPRAALTDTIASIPRMKGRPYRRAGLSAAFEALQVLVSGIPGSFPGTPE